MDIQAIIAYILVAGAVVFLARRFFFRKKKKSGNCGNDDCGCN